MIFCLSIGDCNCAFLAVSFCSFLKCDSCFALRMLGRHRWLVFRIQALSRRLQPQRTRYPWTRSCSERVRKAPQWRSFPGKSKEEKGYLWSSYLSKPYMEFLVFLSSLKALFCCLENASLKKKDSIKYQVFKKHKVSLPSEPVGQFSLERKVLRPTSWQKWRRRSMGPTVWPDPGQGPVCRRSRQWPGTTSTRGRSPTTRPGSQGWTQSKAEVWSRKASSLALCLGSQQHPRKWSSLLPP